MSEHHTFSVKDAVEFGVNKSILLHNFRFWLGINQRNGECQREEATWTFLTAERIASAHAYMSASSVSRWLSELVKAGKIIRYQFGKSNDRTYWYTMPEYVSKNSIFYPKNADNADETNEHAISQSDKSISQSDKSISQSDKSLRFLNKDTNININTNTNTTFAANLMNEINLEMNLSDAKTLNHHKIKSIEILPDVWIKKTCRWKGLTDEIEIFDVVESFLLNILAQESDAKSRGALLVEFSFDKLTAKLNTWVSRYANQKRVDSAHANKFKTKKQVALSPAEAFRENHNFCWEGDVDELSYTKNL